MNIIYYWYWVVLYTNHKSRIAIITLYILIFEELIVPTTPTRFLLNLYVYLILACPIFSLKYYEFEK